MHYLGTKPRDAGYNSVSFLLDEDATPPDLLEVRLERADFNLLEMHKKEAV